MSKSVSVVAILTMLVGGLCVVAAGTNELGFGFGGGGVCAFFPELDGVNAFLSENGIGPMPAFLVGGCGGGRGGVIGGLSLGGMGFGAVGTSTDSYASADLAVGGGGFDLGVAVGGDETSVLTFGAVLGGGASVLDLSLPVVEPQGIIPEPMTRTVGRAFGFVMPYVDFEAQLLPFMGCDVRIGYVLPVVGFDFGDVVGIPAPSLDLSGPYVSVSIAFGGIARVGTAPGSEGKATASGTLELAEPARLSLETPAGDVVVSSYAVDVTQTGSRRIVEWSATWDAGDAAGKGVPPVSAESGPDGASLRATQDVGVSYLLRVPAGTDLDVACGAGTVHIVGHAAGAVRVAVGVGEVLVTEARVGDLSLSAGVGEISIDAASVAKLSAHAGIGRLSLTLPADVSAAVSTSAGLGETHIEGFAGAKLHERGFLWTGGTDAVIGSGAAACSLSVGIGEVEVRAAAPARP